MTNQRFLNKVALVTGGNAGLGEATARAFAREGAKVMIAARRSEEGEAVAAAIRQTGGEALFASLDVTDDQSVKAVVAKCVETFGGLDLAFNNAGITGPAGKRIDQVEVTDFDQVMGINARGVWSCMKYEFTAMLERGGGAIVNCSSTAGIEGGAGMASSYYASKHAVMGMTKNVAVEGARQNIRVNAVLPGMIMTDIVRKGFESNKEKFEMLFNRIPMGRAGEPDDVAAAVLFLCSEEAKFITGAGLSVDGGTTI